MFVQLRSSLHLTPMHMSLSLDRLIIFQVVYCMIKIFIGGRGRGGGWEGVAVQDA